MDEFHNDSADALMACVLGTALGAAIILGLTGAVVVSVRLLGW